MPDHEKISGLGLGLPVVEHELLDVRKMAEDSNPARKQNYRAKVLQVESVSVGPFYESAKLPRSAKVPRPESTREASPRLDTQLEVVVLCLRPCYHERVALEDREESRPYHGKVDILTGPDLPGPREPDLDLETVVHALHLDAGAGLAHGEVAIDEEDVSVCVGRCPYTRPHDDLSSPSFVRLGDVEP